MTADRVLVLGGTGFIGSAVAAAYAARGVSTRALARNEPSLQVARRLDGVEVIKGDILDEPLLDRALSQVRHVVYAVGQMLPAESTRDLLGDVKSALPSIITVLEALRARPGVTITYLSSGGTVYGRPTKLPISETAPCDPITGYGITKLAAEKYLGMYQALYGVQSRVLRISNVYGPGQQAGRSQGVIASLLAVARDDATGVLYGDSVRDYVYVDDAVQAVMGLEPRPGEASVVNVGSGVGHTLSDVVTAVEAASSRTLQLERFAARPFDIKEVVLDVARLRSLMEWSPRPLASGIALAWQRLIQEEQAPGAPT